MSSWIVLGYFVKIDGVSYYIYDGPTGNNRETADYICRTEANMTMISFEGDQQKWTKITEYLISTGIISSKMSCAVNQD